MTLHRRQEIETIFQKATDLAPADRPAYLQRESRKIVAPDNFLADSDGFVVKYKSFTCSGKTNAAR